jgi:hypothetical protein
MQVVAAEVHKMTVRRQLVERADLVAVDEVD